MTRKLPNESAVLPVYYYIYYVYVVSVYEADDFYLSSMYHHCYITTRSWSHLVTMYVVTGVFSVSVVCMCMSYLVDPASRHMLASKIKPCMSKYK